MLASLRSNWVVLTCVAFILINAVLIANEIYWGLAAPAVLLVVWAMFTSLDRLLLFVVFFTPLSLNIEDLGLGGIGMYVPTEPLLFGIMLLLLLKMLMEKNVIDQKVLRHPVSIAILIHLAWLAICILPSSMPMVSFKYLVARSWFVVAVYFLCTRIFEDRRNMYRYVWAYTSALVIVITYTLIHHAQFGFEHDPAHWVMAPFFKDHTSYGASIAFMLPVTLLAVTHRNGMHIPRGVAFFLLVLLVIGLVFSYTRAAWLSLVGALLVYVAMELRIKGWMLAVMLVVAGGTYFAFEEQILIALERNTDESSDDLGEHVRSISNISSDASNLERLNRWNSAIAMWKERPVFGWGPGTYMFQYAPFQASRDRTIISTNFGVGGNAHSEYLGPLSEAGLLGMIMMLAIVILTLHRGIRCYQRMTRGPDRAILLAALMGLVSYYLHGVLNNFLDTDKASIPFWAFTAIIVLIDLKYRNGLGEPGDQHGDVVQIG